MTKTTPSMVGGLRDVGRHDDLPPDGPVRLPPRRRLENPLLEVWRECGVERDALHVPCLGSEVVDLALDALARLLDLLLAGQEHQHVALLYSTHVNLYDGPDCGLQVVPLWLWRVEDLDGVGAAGHVHEGRVVE